LTILTELDHPDADKIKTKLDNLHGTRPDGRPHGGDGLLGLTPDTAV
jgi:hypothetical protein